MAEYWAGPRRWAGLRLGYASALHKVQGATLPHITVWLDVPNMPAAAYVALSRVEYDARWRYIVFFLEGGLAYILASLQQQHCSSTNNMHTSSPLTVLRFLNVTYRLACQVFVVLLRGRPWGLRGGLRRLKNAKIFPPRGAAPCRGGEA